MAREPAEVAIVQQIELPTTMAHGIQIAQTARALARRGVRAHVFARTARGVEADAAFADLGAGPPGDGLELHAVALAHKGLAGAALRLALARLVRRGAACWGRQRRQTLFALGARRRLGGRGRVAYELHNLEHVIAAERGDAARAAAIRAEEERLVREVDVVAAISAPLAEDAAAVFGLAALPAIVPDGVDARRFAGVGCPRLDGPVVRLVYAGSLYAHKGVDALVDAVAVLPERFRLRLVGGNAPADFERLRRRVAELGLGARIELAGQVPATEIPAELAQADLIVLPARAEARSERYTSPLKLFESMATAVPIVAVDVPSYASVLADGETAFLAASPAAADLAAAIGRAAEDGARALAVGRAAAVAAQDYSWDRRADRILALL